MRIAKIGVIALFPFMALRAELVASCSQGYTFILRAG